MSDGWRRSTRYALGFAALSIALFHGYNAYVFWHSKRRQSRTERGDLRAEIE